MPQPLQVSVSSSVNGIPSPTPHRLVRRIKCCTWPAKPVWFFQHVPLKNEDRTNLPLSVGSQGLLGIWYLSPWLLRLPTTAKVLCGCLFNVAIAASVSESKLTWKCWQSSVVMLGDEHNHNTSLELFYWYLQSSSFSQIFPGQLQGAAREFLEELIQDSFGQLSKGQKRHSQSPLPPNPRQKHGKKTSGRANAIASKLPD